MVVESVFRSNVYHVGDYVQVKSPEWFDTYLENHTYNHVYYPDEMVLLAGETGRIFSVSDDCVNIKFDFDKDESSLCWYWRYESIEPQDFEVGDKIRIPKEEYVRKHLCCLNFHEEMSGYYGKKHIVEKKNRYGNFDVDNCVLFLPKEIAIVEKRKEDVYGGKIMGKFNVGDIVRIKNLQEIEKIIVNSHVDGVSWGQALHPFCGKKFMITRKKQNSSTNDGYEYFLQPVDKCERAFYRFWDFSAEMLEHDNEDDFYLNDEFRLEQNDVIILNNGTRFRVITGTRSNDNKTYLESENDVVTDLKSFAENKSFAVWRSEHSYLTHAKTWKTTLENDGWISPNFEMVYDHKAVKVAELTVEEISKRLGYEVKIVKE